MCLKYFSYVHLCTQSCEKKFKIERQLHLTIKNYETSNNVYSDIKMLSTSKLNLVTLRFYLLLLLKKFEKQFDWNGIN